MLMQSPGDYRKGLLHFAGVYLTLGWMQAVPHELEGGSDAGVSKPTGFSLQKDAKPTKMKAPSLELWATILLQRNFGFPGSPQHHHHHPLPLVPFYPLPPFKGNPGS